MVFRILLIINVLFELSPTITHLQDSQKYQLDSLLYSHNYEIKMSAQSCNKIVYIYVQFVDAKAQPKLQKDFTMLTLSMMSKTNCPIHMFITTDEFGIEWTTDLLSYFTKVHPWFVMPTLKYYNIDVLLNLLSKISTSMKVI